MLNNKGIYSISWFWIILFIIIMTVAVRNSYYRQVIYDDLYKDQLLQQQQEDYYQQQMEKELQKQYEQEQYEEMLKEQQRKVYEEELKQQQEEEYQKQLEEKQEQENYYQQNKKETHSLTCSPKYLPDEIKCSGRLVKIKYQYSDCSYTWVDWYNCSYKCMDGKCVYAETQCNSQYLNEYRCNENVVERKYQYSNCSTYWIEVENCKYGYSNGECNSEPQQHIYDMSLCKGSADCFVGTVSYISDGDTLTINGIEIRLALTNTPESYQAGFSEAKQFTESLCPVGFLVLVDEDDGQPDGSWNRTIAVVYCGNYNLNEELLKSGYGQIWIEYCEVSEFRNESWALKFGC